MNDVKNTITALPLNQALFSAFGEVIQTMDRPDMLINEGKCARYHDLAALDFESGSAGLSVFKADCYPMPHQLRMMERHPLGSQAFIPMQTDPFLIAVAPDEGGRPGIPLAFLTNGQQGVNYHRNVWHGVLTPLTGSGLFTVVDRIGEGNNLQEYWFEESYQIKIPLRKPLDS